MVGEPLETRDLGSADPVFPRRNERPQGAGGALEKLALAESASISLLGYYSSWEYLD